MSELLRLLMRTKFPGTDHGAVQGKHLTSAGERVIWCCECPCSCRLCSGQKQRPYFRAGISENCRRLFSHPVCEPPESPGVHAVWVRNSSCGASGCGPEKPGSLSHTMEGRVPAHLRNA